MKTNRKDAIVVGLLFIVATVSYSIAIILLEQIPDGANYLADVSDNVQLVMLSAFLVLIDAIAVAGIGIIIYPFVSIFSRTFAFVYAGIRIIECVLFMFSAITILSLVTLSRELLNNQSIDPTHYHVIGSMLVSAGDWASLIGLGFVFSISALILNFALYKTKLIPRWLSGLGFVGAVLVFINFCLVFLDIKPVDILFIPIAIQEMVFAVWIIVRGFNVSATEYAKPAT